MAPALDVTCPVEQSLPVATGCTASNERSSACGCAPSVREKRANDCPCADPPCTTSMTDALPSVHLGVAGSSLLCSGTDLTAPPLILIQTRFQGFSGRGYSSAMALVDSGASYNFMLSALAKSLGWRIMPASMHVRLANGEKLSSLG